MSKNNINEKKKSVTHSTKKEIATLKSRIAALDKKLETVSGKKLEPYKFTGIVHLLIDCSGSMAESNKMDQAKRGAIGFATEAIERGYHVGLISFASYAELLLKPQSNLIEFNKIIERMTANGSTNMTDAIGMATNELKSSIETKLICIVTDGMPDDKKSTLEAVNEAKTNGVDIMAIGTDDADKEFLERIVTQKELSFKVSREKFEESIISMAKMLPEK
jgi:Mg-chelatase subunit ChlD